MRALSYVVFLFLSLLNVVAGIALLVLRHTFATWHPLEIVTNFLFQIVWGLPLAAFLFVLLMVCGIISATRPYAAMFALVLNTAALGLVLFRFGLPSDFDQAVFFLPVFVALIGFAWLAYPVVGSDPPSPRQKAESRNAERLKELFRRDELPLVSGRGEPRPSVAKTGSRPPATRLQEAPGWRATKRLRGLIGLRVMLRRGLAIFGAVVLVFASTGAVNAGGVTIITHGFNSNVTDWIIPMAGKVGVYPGFPGATYSCYEISITRNGSGQYVAAASLIGGIAPLLTDSGEIVVKLDWSTLSGLGGPPTTTIADAAVSALFSTNLIPEMGGRPLAELPLHLIGHSRGGSVITEMARLLGAQGVWVDQVTTLDPRPVSQFGDASVTSWTNVLFADNFWQTMGDGIIVPNGQSVFGAYNRKLLNLSGGYSSSHSDVHLWYHGTIDLATPASDTQATITASQRSAWWTSTEMSGATAGFLYSLIGGGDRLSNQEPAGTGNGRINDGFNRNWDLGGGMAVNRTALPANAGLWPNPILFALGSTGTIAAGESFDVTLYYQAGASAAGNIDLEIFLDADFNPYNGNEIEVDQQTLTRTGTNAVSFNALNAIVNAAEVTPGTYSVCARLNDGVRTRYLYTQELLVVTPSLQPPSIDAASIVLGGGVMRFDVHAFPGQEVTVMASTDLVNWGALETHTFTGTVWEFVDADAGNFVGRFYRAILAEVTSDPPTREATAWRASDE